MVSVLLTDRLRISVGLFHHVLVYMVDLHLVLPTNNKFEDVLLDHDGLPHVLPLAVQVEFFFA